MERTLKINDIQKRIKTKERFLNNVNKDNYKLVGYNYSDGDGKRQFWRQKKLLKEITEADLKDLNTLLKRVENKEKIKANWF